MAVTLTQITSATDALAVSKLTAQMQMEGNASYEAERALAVTERTAAAARSAAIQTSMDAQTAAVTRAAAASERAVALQEAMAAELPNANQELFLSLYGMHLKTRLGASVITSNTADTVMSDIVTDAHRMTETVYPAMRASLDRLATPQV